MRRSRDVHSLLSTAFCLCTNSKAVGGTQPTALPCCPSAAFLGGNVGCLTGSEVGAFTSVPVLPLRQGRNQSDPGRITLARFHSRANLLPSDCANRVRAASDKNKPATHPGEFCRI